MSPVQSQTPMAGDPLAGLRDLHLPAEPGLWPPAPGWWVLGVAVLALLIAAVAWARHRRRGGPRLRVRARRSLQALAEDHAGSDDTRALLRDVAAWQRRVAVACFGPDAASITGAQWTARLCAQGDPRDADVWAAVAEHRYQPRPPAVDRDALLAACRRWLEAVTR